MATKTSKKINPALIDDENPEWTQEDFKRARPADKVLREIFPPEAAEAMLAPRKGRPAGSGKKTSATLRFDNDILAAFRATGKGWQTRMNDALRQWLKEHKPA
jgi:uncharacterized protein (DUF4415 family)